MLMRLHRLISSLLIIQLFLDDATSTAADSVIIREAGLVHQFRSHDIALEFYATAKNTGSTAQSVSLTLKKCCFVLSERVTSCESTGFSSHHRLPVELYPDETKNLTTFILNMYLEKRHGFCILRASWHPANFKRGSYTDNFEFQLNFNTSTGNEGFVEKYLGNIFGSGDEENENNEDLTSDGRHVNCLIKYRGVKSYFNLASNKCEEVPSCPDSEKVLSRTANKCKRIENVAFTEEMSALPDVTEIGALSYKIYPLKIICIHGKRTSFACECDHGWVSNTFPSKTFNPEDDTYTMCNLKAPTRTSHVKAKSAEITFFVLVLIMAILCVTCFLCVAIYCRKQRDKKGSVIEAKNNSSQEIPASRTISEIKNRREIVLPPPKPFQTKTEIITPQTSEEKFNNFVSLPERAKSFDAVAASSSEKLDRLNDFRYRPPVNNNFNTRATIVISEKANSYSSIQIEPEKSQESRIKVSQNSSTRIPPARRNPSEVQTQKLYAVPEESKQELHLYQPTTTIETETSELQPEKRRRIDQSINAMPIDLLNNVTGEISSSELLYSPVNSNSNTTLSDNSGPNYAFHSILAPINTIGQQPGRSSFRSGPTIASAQKVTEQGRRFIRASPRRSFGKIKRPPSTSKLNESQVREVMSELFDVDAYNEELDISESKELFHPGIK